MAQRISKADGRRALYGLNPVLEALRAGRRAIDEITIAEGVRHQRLGELLEFARARNVVRLIEQLKERNVWVVGTVADAPSRYNDWDWTLPAAVVMGGEGSGLHRLVRERCDTLVSIPLFGQVGSLNVSVAAGIVLFEARRQRAASSKH